MADVSQEQDLKDWNNTYDGRVKVWFGLRTLFNDSDKLVSGTGREVFVLCVRKRRWGESVGEML